MTIMVTNGFFSGDFNGHFSVHLTWISRRKYPWLTILAFSWHLWHTLLAFLLAFWVFVFHLLYKLSLFCATCIYLHSSGQSLGYSFSPYSLSLGLFCLRLGLKCYNARNIPCKLLHTIFLGFPGGANGKEPACQCRRHMRCGFNHRTGKIS